jgi:hypothetical protein
VIPVLHALMYYSLSAIVSARWCCRRVVATGVASASGSKPVRDARTAHAQLLSTLAGELDGSLTSEELSAVAQWVFEAVREDRAAARAPVSERLGPVSDAAWTRMCACVGAWCCV